MTARSPKPRQPPGLDAPGRALWKRFTSAYVLEPWEVTILEMAARQADDVKRLDDAIREDGVLTEGSQGQSRLAGVVSEARAGRQALAKLLGLIKLPSSDGAAEDEPQSAAGRRAQKAAQKRWADTPRLPRGKGPDRGDTAS